MCNIHMTIGIKYGYILRNLQTRFLPELALYPNLQFLITEEV